MAFHSLKTRSALMVTALYGLVGLLTLLGFWGVARGVVATFGRRFAEKHVVLDKHRILAPVQREVALARKMADDPALRSWLMQEQDPVRRKAGLEALESYRRHFTDGSAFFIHDASRHYYFNNAQKEFTGQELRYVLDASDPTMAWYAAAMKEIEDFALHVDRSEQLGLVKVWINVMVRVDGRKAGLTGTGLDLTGFVKSVVQGSEAGVQTILVDAQGMIQAHPDAALMDYNARMKEESQRISLQKRVTVPAERVGLEERFVALLGNPDRVDTFYLTVDGHRQLVAATGLPDIGWVALALVDPSQVVGLRAFAPIAGLLLLSLLVAIVLVVLLVNRMVLVRLERLRDSACRIAEGHYELDLEDPRQDEIGELTRAFSHMTATVRDATHHLETKVQERTEALSEAHARLLASNQKIMDSLDVAQLLQSSLLPEASQLQRLLPEHFSLYRPRDQVGGDFYACFSDPEGFVVAMADCTGHGVPGALMTMSARSVLEQLLAEFGPEDPGRLLRELNRAMKAMLNRPGPRGSLDNGLDMGLMRVSTREKRLQYASARLPLWVRHPDGRWEELPGDRQSLGYRRSDPDHPFESVERPLEPGVRYYLLTDGLLDQAGGPKGFGLGRRRLREWFDAHADQPMGDQGAALEAWLSQYQGACTQRDDMTILGFTLNPNAFVPEP